VAIRVLIFELAGLGMSDVARGQDLGFCAVPKIIVPATLRAEGRRERLSAIDVICTGGTPTPAGQPVPMVKIAVALNVPVTSPPIEAGGLNTLIGAFATVDRPAAGKISVCRPPDVSNGTGTFECPATGTGDGIGTYDPT
jgi:hypothetical protein